MNDPISQLNAVRGLDDFGKLVQAHRHQLSSQKSVQCRVCLSWWDGNAMRHMRGEKWMSEENALAYAAGARSSGKPYQIRIHYRRKFQGRWRNSGSKPYPPEPPSASARCSNDQAHPQPVAAVVERKKDNQ